jgi:copper chaperone CopZ
MGCPMGIAAALEELPGVMKVEFDSEREVFVVHCGEVVSVATILQRIREAGVRHGRAYEPTVVTSEIDNRTERRT